MDSSYLINMDDGRLVFRNSETDNQVNLRPVSNELVAMIVSGEVEAMDVVNAISAKIKENGDFNLSQYIEDLKKLNIRKSNPQRNVVHEQLKDRTNEEVSVEDVKIAKSKTSGNIATTKRERAKKVNEALDNADMPDIFK